MASGFKLIPPFDEAEEHELALNSAGYGWTMIRELSYDTAVEDLRQLGKVGYLIKSGHLTFNRKDKVGRAAFAGRNKIVHLGVRDRKPDDKRAVLRRQITVQKNGLYDIEANKKEGCTFVEGHVCLSPAFAIELLNAGQIQWLAEGGKKISDATMVKLLQDTTIESRRVKVRGTLGMQMKFTVTVPNAEKDRNARQLKQWFENEWDDYESKTGCTRKVDTKKLYQNPANAEKKADKTTTVEEVGGSESK